MLASSSTAGAPATWTSSDRSAVARLELEVDEGARVRCAKKVDGQDRGGDEEGAGGGACSEDEVRARDGIAAHIGVEPFLETQGSSLFEGYACRVTEQDEGKGGEEDGWDPDVRSFADSGEGGEEGAGRFPVGRAERHPAEHDEEQGHPPRQESRQAPLAPSREPGAMDGQGQAVETAPYDEVPARAVPETSDEHRQHEVAVRLR